MHFTKMHGLGNDYLYVYGQVPPNAADLSVLLSERHFGAGSDGMIYISPLIPQISRCGSLTPTAVRP